MIPGTFKNASVPPAYPAGIYELYEYGIFSRESAAADGLPASCTPPPNPNWPAKNWVALDVDDTVPNVFMTLQTTNEGGTSQIDLPAKLVPFITQPGQASTLNLPAGAVYPAYVIAPTDAYEQSGDQHLAVNPLYLSTMEQAQSLASQLGVSGANIIEYQPAAGPAGYQYVYPADEARRYYQFKDSLGQIQTVGMLLYQMYGSGASNQFFGVGAPGSWTNNGVSWTWTPAYSAPIVPASGPLVPMPMRALQPGEAITSVSDGMGLMLTYTPPSSTKK